MKKEKIKVDFCFAFLGHPELDSRITNFYDSLTERGKKVAIIGFDWFGKGKIKNRENYFLYSVKRRPSLIFYFDFIKNLRKTLAQIDAEIYVAEDIYTLPLVYKAAKKRNAKIYYDSRELYNFIGGLARKPFIQKTIAAIEKKYIAKVDLIIVTGEMDAEFLAQHYSLPEEKFVVIRNLPKRKNITPATDLRAKIGAKPNSKMLVYQGILSEGRGLEKTLEALRELPDTFLLVLGDGPLRDKLEASVKEKNLSGRVYFTGMISNDELLNYTAVADAGLVLIENISKSYYYALPNKLFEYISVGIPVVASPLPQMKKIAENYDVGVLANPENVNEIINAIKKLFSDADLYEQYKLNALKAAEELNWEKEFEKAERFFV